MTHAEDTPRDPNSPAWEVCRGGHAPRVADHAIGQLDSVPDVFEGVPMFEEVGPP